MRSHKKNNVLVTVADHKRLDQAKQLFINIKHNSFWNGDRLLLTTTTTIPSDIQWFKKNGIKVVMYPLILKKIGISKGIFSLKLSLFRIYMKKWKNVVYLDTDVIVRHPLDQLSNKIGFWAAPELVNKAIIFQFLLKDKKSWLLLRSLLKEIGINFKPTNEAFNAGVLAFSTSIIKNGLYQTLQKLLIKYSDICCFGDQTILNICFYNKWTKLPRIYNYHPLKSMKFCLPNNKDKKAIIMHFAGEFPHSRPWDKKNPYYNMWKNGLLDNGTNSQIKSSYFPYTLEEIFYKIIYFPRLAYKVIKYHTYKLQSNNH